MMKPRRHSTEDEIAALEAVCQRLANFGADVSLEWVDGFLTAVAASRRLIAPELWLPAMLGDEFSRAFADPADVQQAMHALLARCSVLAQQLDPESLLEAPDEIRLGPLMITFDDESRREVVAAGYMSAVQAEEQLQTGAQWADGFCTAIDSFAEDWPDPDEQTEEGRWYDDCLTRVLALGQPKAELDSYLAEAFPGDTLTRDELVDDACFGVQDLRVYWLDHAPKPATRHVDVKPGRNEPCHCGSGKKFKKCHGAAVN